MATAPVPARIQAVKVPVPVLDSPTVPDGVVGDAAVSVTVIVQLVELLTTNVVG